MFAQLESHLHPPFSGRQNLTRKVASHLDKVATVEHSKDRGTSPGFVISLGRLT